MDMRRKLRRITVAAKGNPTLQIGDLVKMSGLISTMTEKYMVTAIQSGYTASGYIDQIDLEYVGKADGGHICEAKEDAYEVVEDSVAGGGLFPVLTSRWQQLVNYASQYLGTWYQWGGDSAHNRSHYGMDCSHYVWTVFEHFGLMDQYRTSAEMYKHCIPISDSEAKEGDLVFFEVKGKITHVGICIGNGKMFSAKGRSSTTTTGLAMARGDKVQVNVISRFGGTPLFARVKGW